MIAVTLLGFTTLQLYIYMYISAPPPPPLLVLIALDGCWGGLISTCLITFKKNIRFCLTYIHVHVQVVPANTSMRQKKVSAAHYDRKVVHSVWNTLCVCNAIPLKIIPFCYM